VVHFEWSEGAASPVLDDIVQGPAAALTAVALVAGRRARASGWAARAAAAIAARWGGPRRVVLVDFDLERPALHETVGIANEEGVADVAEYGVSLSLVRRPMGGYDVVTAGEYAPHPEAALRSPAWEGVLAEIAAERATLLASVPADAPGADAVIGWAGAVIVLAEPDESDAVIESLPSAYAVLVALSPWAPAPAESAVAAAGAATDAALLDASDDEPLVIAAAADEVISADQADQAVRPGRPGRPGRVQDTSSRLSDAEFERIRLPTDRASRDALIAELRERQRDARMAPTPADPVPRRGAAGAAGAAKEADAARAADEAAETAAGSPVLLPASGSEHAREMRVEASADDVTLETLDPGKPRDEARGWGPKRRVRFQHPALWTLTVVLIVSLLAGAWHFLSGRIGADALGGRGAPAASAPADATDPAAAEPETFERELPYSVALEAHTDLVRAFGRLETLAQEREFSFFIAPLEREGTLYYHIMAGPVSDSAVAIELRDTLLARRLKTTETPTDVRHTPLAFHVGDYGTRDVAEQAMSELRRLDVPSYMLYADADDGYPLYRVYVGAFTSQAEADVTRQLLRAAGVQDSLVTRTGSIAP
jgi:hypothetical protein